MTNNCKAIKDFLNIFNNINTYNNSFTETKKHVKRLLRNYRSMRCYSRNAVFSHEGLPELLQLIDLENVNMGNLKITSIEQNKALVDKILTKIDSIIEIYKRMCEEEIYHALLYETYLSKYKNTAVKISLDNYISEKTYFRYMDEIINQLTYLYLVSAENVRGVPDGQQQFGL